jgi:hypothetical protein
MVVPTDRAAIETALRVCGQPEAHHSRVVRIKNTLSLGEIDVSAGLLSEALPNFQMTPVADVFELSFDAEENLLPIMPSH